MGLKPRTQGNRDAKRINELLDQLQSTWGHAVCELDFKTPFQLLVATILSAQSTDKRVNMTTPALFERYPTAEALAKAEPAEIEPIIHSTGFFRQKAKNIVNMARMLVAEHDGEVPRDLEALVKLPGVARKTANVVLGTAYGIASGVVVDTHVIRLSNRLGLTESSDPVKIEQDLQRVLPRERWIDFSHQLIWHGRRTCHARKPLCNDCTLAPLCPGREI